jgi:uncharacterized protein (DUF433 family)
MSESLLGIGLYTSMEASRLLKTPSSNISRWLRGYSYKDNYGDEYWVDAIWEPELDLGYNDQVQLSFRDLMEVRFIDSFRKAGLPLQTVRSLYKQACELINDVRPFSTAEFRTDGKTIFFDVSNEIREDNDLIDLRDLQHVFKRFIEPTFKDIEYNNSEPIRWWPQKNNKNIVLDPQRSFGQPIVEKEGIPTSTLYTVFLAEDESFKEVADIYEIPIQAVKSAVNFERSLLGI